MIKICKPSNPPQILKDKAREWTDKLVEAVKKYGGYKKIPKDEKKRLISNYRHQQIKDALFPCSYEKCAFCECIPGESGNIEVEHFAPKSIYYKKTFEWDNLLPVCRKCNDAKLDFDTIKEPILNPTKADPEEYLSYSSLCIVPSQSSPDISVSERTIKVCNLECPRLYKARADLLCSLTEYEKNLKDCVDEIQPSGNKIDKHKKVIRLRNSIEAIDKLKEAKEKYAGFCRHFLETSETYKKAKSILVDYFDDQEAG